MAAQLLPSSTRAWRRTLALAALTLGLLGAAPQHADAHSLPWLIGLPFDKLLTIRIRAAGEHLASVPPSGAPRAGAGHAR